MISNGMRDPHLLARLLLRFELDDEHDDTPHNLSAAALEARSHLWVASDERGFLERLSSDEPRIYGRHQRFRLVDYLPLQGQDEEIDIEALDLNGGSLWLVGSHSTKRKKPKGRNDQKDLDRLATIEKPENRFVLAKLPLAGQASPRAPQAKGARCLPTSTNDGEPSNPLFDELAEDEHLAPFIRMAIPSKDNGFDIEGLAVQGDTLLLGLRGPVLRGYAVLLLLEIGDGPSGELALARKKGRAYRKLFLDLDGLGIRDLSFLGEDVLILAGPTMALDGPIRLFRLKNPLSRKSDGVVQQDRGGITRLFDIPHTENGEHAEGVSLFSWFAENDSILAVYDSPAQERLYEAHAVLADVFRIP
jgi:Protein of unknown function (DUF3616)